MNKQQPNWLKIVYIVVFLAIAAYTYYQQAQPGFQPAQAGNQQAGNQQAGERADERADEQADILADESSDGLASGGSVANGSAPTKRGGGNAGRNSDTGGRESHAKSGGKRSGDERPREEETAPNAAAEYGVTTFRWSKVQRDEFTTPEGLVYGMGPRNEHRLEHVFRHAQDQPNRSGPHGVFDGSPDDVLGLLDEAYKLAKFRSRDVTITEEGGRTTYDINMKKRIGYVGGQTGKRNDNPPAKRIRLILEGSSVVTAYPR